MSQLVEQLTEFLSAYPQVELAILFGSQTAGNATAESDIDLALLAQQPISPDLKLELVEPWRNSASLPAVFRRSQ